MNRNTIVLLGSLVAALSTGTHAAAAESAGQGYCTIPYLYATNIRASCEQFGTKGLESLVSGSRMFDQMLNRPHIADVFPDPALHRNRS